MNQAGRDKLREAWVRGTRQAFGAFQDGEDGFCALGVLGMCSSDVRKPGAPWGQKTYGLGKRAECPVCGELWTYEGDLLIHLNDDHKFDFGKIADLMPRSEDANAS